MGKEIIFTLRHYNKEYKAYSAEHFRTLKGDSANKQIPCRVCYFGKNNKGEDIFANECRMRGFCMAHKNHVKHSVYFTR